jgi:hypothetical protein
MTAPAVKQRRLQITNRVVAIYFKDHIKLGPNLVENYIVFDGSVSKFKGIMFSVRNQSLVIKHQEWPIEVEVPFEMIKCIHKKYDKRIKNTMEHVRNPDKEE